MASERTRILMFHRVQPDLPTAFGLPSCYRLRGTSLTWDEFERAVEAARPIISLAAVEEALAQNRKPPPGSVLTFDDGHREHLDTVAPWLAQQGHAATFYVATGLHGAGCAVAAVDAWYWLLDHAPLAVGEVQTPDGTVFRERVDTLDGKTQWVTGAPKAALLSASPFAQSRMVDELASSLGCVLPDDLACRLYLTPDEWILLGALGMRVGAHSVGHVRLTQADDRTLRDEVERSIAAVGRLGSGVAFSYPDGAYDERVRRVVERSGASSSVTCVPADVTLDSDPLLLPRWFVSPVEAARSSGA